MNQQIPMPPASNPFKNTQRDVSTKYIHSTTNKKGVEETKENSL